MDGHKLSIKDHILIIEASSPFEGMSTWKLCRKMQICFVKEREHDSNIVQIILLHPRYSVEFDDTPKPQENVNSNYLDNNSKAIQWVEINYDITIIFVCHITDITVDRVGYRMTGYEGLESPTASPKYGSSPKYSEETVTCDSDGKPDYIKGKHQLWLSSVVAVINF